MNGPEYLAQQVGRLKTRVGGFFPGSHVVFRGHNLHTDLKDMDWMELYVFGICGRRFSAQQLRLMNALWTYTSYPDARIWNNRVAALTGTARSTGNLGLSAALAISEAHIYGRGNEVQAIAFFISTQKRLAAGETLSACIQDEMKAHHRIAGYGRPLINADERIAPIMAQAKALGLESGPHLQLAFSIEQHLLENGRNLRLNYGGVVSAFGADLGMSQEEFYLFMFPSFLAGMSPCFQEARDETEGSLFPLRCADILYEGTAPRAWRLLPEEEPGSIRN
ncbi:MAG TPA: hypothetical protein VJ572_10800 [Azonexus sp.]|nr:hypothetical protein [Azonexus sp.]